jgi:hypothetical protein
LFDNSFVVAVLKPHHANANGIAEKVSVSVATTNVNDDHVSTMDTTINHQHISCEYCQ